MRKFKLLPHTADIRLYVEADTLEELFKGALGGMCEIMKTGSSRGKVENTSKIVEINSLDTTSLLIDFLSEVLEYSQEEGNIYPRLKILSLKNGNLKAEIFGREAKGFDRDVKAATYHEAEVKKNAEGKWNVTIVFDI